MPFVPIQPPNGLMLNGTEYDAQGRYRLANLVRFFRGSPEPVGGWTRLPLAWEDSDNITHQLDRLNGVCRGIFSWRDNNENRWMVIGTTQALYLFDGSVIIDITPAGLLPGDENANYGSGYGAYFYSEDHDDPDTHTGGTAAYSTERPAAITSLVQEPGAWTFDTWGENLVACPNWDGKIYTWAPGDALATVVAAAAGEVPEQNRAVLVSDERHMVAIGAGDYGGAIFTKNSRRVAWSNSEDHDVWTASTTNSAGDLQLQTKGVAVTGVKFRGEILIWTDIDMHRMAYIGAPFYYSIKRLSSSAGILSVNANVVTSDFAFWVGFNGFYVYDGSVRSLAPDVSDYYRDNINLNQVAKVACGHNPNFKEIWTFYPSNDSDEIDSYVLWNYEENVWSVGELNRTCWDEAEIWDNPIATKFASHAGFTMFQDVFTLGSLMAFGVAARDLWMAVFQGPDGAQIFGEPIEYPVIEAGSVRVTGWLESPVYVENTDYEVDYARGLLKILSTGSIGVNDTVYFDAIIPDHKSCLPYNHEDGFTDDGADRNIWLETAPFEIASGDKLAVVKRIIQDTGRQDDLDPVLNSDAMEISFKTRLAPEAAAIVEGPYTLDTMRGYTDVRFTGRQVSMKFQQVKNELWRVGKYRLDIKPGSGR